MPLVAKNLCFTYPGSPAAALAGLSLQASPGGVTVLCGAARSGRSTALALMAGLHAPQEGSVTVDGVPVGAPAARGRVGLLLQNADEGLFGLTVREDVMFAPRQLNQTAEEASSRADEALQLVQLNPGAFGGRSPFSLSGGQRRRAAMAGVLAMRPTYLLLDEPFAGLDPQGRHEIVAVIQDIATRRFGEHTGILVALSELDLALQVGHNLVILHEGRAAWQGSVAEFVAHTPDVSVWGLERPRLVDLAWRLRQCGWHIDIDDASPRTLAQAIASHVRGAAQ